MSDSSKDEVERFEEPDGAVFELHKKNDGASFEVHLEGRRLFSCPERRCEQTLAEIAMAPLAGRDDINVLLAGLSQGYVLRGVLNHPGVQRVDVVEPSSAVLAWQGRHFFAHNGDVLKDPRVHLHQHDLRFVLQSPKPAEVPDGWMALILDIDQGPTSAHRPQNLFFYTDEGLELMASGLRPGGVLATWSALREREFLRRLNGMMQNVAEVAVPVEVDGQSSLDYLYRARRPARADGPHN